jgi:hypothetical protein
MVGRSLITRSQMTVEEAVYKAHKLYINSSTHPCSSLGNAHLPLRRSMGYTRMGDIRLLGFGETLGKPSNKIPETYGQ